MLALSLMLAMAAPATWVTDDPVRYAKIRCRNVKDAALHDCQVAFVDRGEEKVAAYVTAPDGRTRIVHFRRGVPWATDAGSRLSFDRNRDTLVIRVGRAEVYEVPDRLIPGK